jgi:hypothetical protein
MGKRMRRLRLGTSQSGQAIVMFAVAITAFLAMMALGVDLVSMYVFRRDAQGVADLAALGGAQKGTPDAQRVEARAIIALNGYTEGTLPNQATLCINPYYREDDNECPTAVDSGSGGLEVTITYHTPGLFSSVLGTLLTDAFGRAVAFCKQLNNYAVFAGTTEDNQGIDWTGGSSGTVTVDGRVHSNEDLKFGGTNKTFNAGVTYVDSVAEAGGQNFRPGYPQQTTVQDYPIGPFTKSQFPCNWSKNGAVSTPVSVDNAAIPTGDFNLGSPPGDWWETGPGFVLKAGVYCVKDGKITLPTNGGNNNGLAGVTMVADGNTGQIGNVHVRDIKPFGYVAPPPGGALGAQDPHNILFINFGGSNVKPGIDLNIDGGGTWTGWIYQRTVAQNPGPAVQLDGGNASTLLGGIFADTIKLTGSGYGFTGTGPGGDCFGAMSE